MSTDIFITNKILKSFFISLSLLLLTHIRKIIFILCSLHKLKLNICDPDKLISNIFNKNIHLTNRNEIRGKESIIKTSMIFGRVPNKLLDFHFVISLQIDSSASVFLRLC